MGLRGESIVYTMLKGETSLDSSADLCSRQGGIMARTEHRKHSGPREGWMRPVKLQSPPLAWPFSSVSSLSFFHHDSTRQLPQATPPPYICFIFKSDPNWFIFNMLRAQVVRFNKSKKVEYSCSREAFKDHIVQLSGGKAPVNHSLPTAQL